MYRVEKNQAGGNDIVIDGFESGIGQSPYASNVVTPLGSMLQTGLSDMRNMNIISVPGEASVQFATTKSSLGSFSATISSADATADTCTYTSETGTPVDGMAVVFAGGSLPSGISAGTQSASADTNVYWIGSVNTGTKTFKVYTNVALTSLVNITGTGTGTVATINMTQPRHYTIDNVTGGYGNYTNYLIDSTGRVWVLTANGWQFTANLTRTNANGNGLVYYRGYILAFRNAAIDYYKISTVTWTYGWTPANGGSGANGLNTAAGTGNSHHAIVGTDDTIYICDDRYLDSIEEVTGQTFDPTTTSTYTWASQALILVKGEIAQWLSELGGNLMIMGRLNRLYAWDKTSTGTGFPIFLPEDGGYADLSVIHPTYPKLVTINTNTFIFTGNRGRIYVTNGVNADIFVKVPDHLSGTVEPYFMWGAVGYNKNQLYFGVLATTNSQGALSTYGGLWAVDAGTKSLRVSNQLSYGSYAGYATVFIPNPSTGSGGSFYVGWDDGSSGYGADSSSSNVYTNYESYIDSDLIPVGTYLTPYTPAQVEFKLTTPLVSGETVRIQYRLNITDAFTTIDTTSVTGILSAIFTANFQNAQWVQLRVLTKGTNTTPSYVRLREVRIRNS